MGLSINVLLPLLKTCLACSKCLRPSLVSSNTTAGSVNIEAAGNSATGDAIKLNASGATGGNVSITAAGPVTGAVAGVSITATNTASGKIEVLSSGDSTTEDAVSISALGTTGGNLEQVSLQFLLLLTILLQAK